MSVYTYAILMLCIFIALEIIIYAIPFRWIGGHSSLKQTQTINNGERYSKFGIGFKPGLMVACGFLLLIVYCLGLGSVRYPDSFFDDINNAAINTSDVKMISVFNDYKDSPNYNVSIKNRKEILNFINKLRYNTTIGHIYKNHPACIRGGKIKIQLSDGEFYFIYFDIYAYKDYQYLSFDSLPKGAEGAIFSKHYENILLGEYLDDLIRKEQSRNGITH